MQCIKLQFSHESVVKRSRFISRLTPVANESEVHAILRQSQLDFPDATHITYAYRINTTNGLLNRFHDAGEPSGTAGKPIYKHLEGKNLINVLLLVIRYFGGIKLGAGGLTRAYGNAAKQIIEFAELYPYIEYIDYRMALDYKQLSEFELVLKKLQGKIISQHFFEKIQIAIQIPKQNVTVFTQLYGECFLEKG